MTLAAWSQTHLTTIKSLLYTTKQMTNNGKKQQQWDGVIVTHWSNAICSVSIILHIFFLSSHTFFWVPSRCSTRPDSSSVRFSAGRLAGRSASGNCKTARQQNVLWVVSLFHKGSDVEHTTYWNKINSSFPRNFILPKQNQLCAFII